MNIFEMIKNFFGTETKTYEQTELEAETQYRAKMLSVNRSIDKLRDEKIKLENEARRLETAGEHKKALAKMRQITDKQKIIANSEKLAEQAKEGHEIIKDGAAMRKIYETITDVSKALISTAGDSPDIIGLPIAAQAEMERVMNIADSINTAFEDASYDNNELVEEEAEAALAELMNKYTPVPAVNEVVPAASMKNIGNEEWLSERHEQVIDLVS